MTQDELMNCFQFDNEEEKHEAEFYIAMKSIALHVNILTYLNLDFGKEATVKWKKVSHLIRKDKRIRDKLYVYLATLEEFVRAYISNKYSNDLQKSFWINGKGERNAIKKKIDEGGILFEILEEIDFGTLISQVKALPDEDRKLLFNGVGSDENLDAVKELRNTVSHHKFLYAYKFKPCETEQGKSNTLQNNILNLRQLLPNAYRYGKDGNGGITADMKKCGIELSI